MAFSNSINLKLCTITVNLFDDQVLHDINKVLTTSKYPSLLAVALKNTHKCWSHQGWHSDTSILLNTARSWSQSKRYSEFETSFTVSQTIGYNPVKSDTSKICNMLVKVSTHNVNGDLYPDTHKHNNPFCIHSKKNGLQYDQFRTRTNCAWTGYIYEKDRTVGQKKGNHPRNLTNRNVNLT